MDSSKERVDRALIRALFQSSNFGLLPLLHFVVGENLCRKRRRQREQMSQKRRLGDFLQAVYRNAT